MERVFVCDHDGDGTWIITFLREKNFILIKKHFFQIKITIISLKKQSNSRQQPAFKGV